jgi:hypothetical protein
MWIIVFKPAPQAPGDPGWCVVDLESKQTLTGPYATHQEACDAAETRAHRLSKGWVP